MALELLQLPHFFGVMICGAKRQIYPDIHSLGIFFLRWVSVEKHQWRPDGEGRLLDFAIMASPKDPGQFMNQRTRDSMISRKHHETPTNHPVLASVWQSPLKERGVVSKIASIPSMSSKDWKSIGQKWTNWPMTVMFFLAHFEAYKFLTPWPILNQAASAHAETVGREWWPEPQERSTSGWYRVIYIGGALWPRLGDLQLRFDANDGKLKSLQEATTGG